MRVGLTTSIATAIAIGVLIASGGGVTPGTANLWIDTNGGTCTRSAALISYTGVGDAASCASLLAAYTAASSTDTIGLKGATYTTTEANNTLTGTKTLTITVPDGETASFTNPVRFDSLENVTVNGPLDTKPAYVVNTNLVTDFSVGGCSRNLNLNDISASLYEVVGSSDNITFTGGDFGNYDDADEEDSWVGGDGPTSPCNDASDGIVTNIVMDGVYIHDVLFVAEAGWGDAHPDCIQTGGFVDGWTIKNSTFARCGNSFLGLYGDFGDFTNLTLENNDFYGIMDSFWGFNIDPKTFVCSITVRYNTYWPDNPASAGYAYSPPSILCQTRTVVGNIFQAGEPGGCGAFSGGWDYNVFAIDDASHDPCGTNTTIGDPGFTDSTGPVYDFHLAVGALALGKGKPGSAPTDFPSTDFEGTARTSPPDAGYDER